MSSQVTTMMKMMCSLSEQQFGDFLSLVVGAWLNPLRFDCGHIICILTCRYITLRIMSTQDVKCLG